MAENREIQWRVYDVLRTDNSEHTRYPEQSTCMRLSVTPCLEIDDIHPRFVLDSFKRVIDVSHV